MLKLSWRGRHCAPRLLESYPRRTPTSHDPNRPLTKLMVYVSMQRIKVFTDLMRSAFLAVLALSILDRCSPFQPPILRTRRSITHRVALPRGSGGLLAAKERDEVGRIMLKSLSLPDLKGLLNEMGEGNADEVAGRVWRWMYAKDTVISRWDEASRKSAPHCLSKALCERLEGLASLDGGLALEKVVPARDGTKKLVLQATTGPAKGKTVEAVIIPMVRGPQKSARYTLCVSSQAGCAMNCQFCYTGRLGLLGNLMASQIVEQLVHARRYLAEIGDPIPIQRMVFMGMGEPLDNYDAVMKALATLTEQHGNVLLGPRKIMVSTVGLVDSIERFLRETSCDLAVSVHATTDEVRDWLVPVNNRWKLSELMAALRREYGRDNRSGGGGGGGHLPRRRRSPLAVEYVMLKGINDSLDDARRLAEMVGGLSCAVNLIGFNRHDGTMFEPSPPEQINAFRAVLRSHGILSTHRHSKGDDEMSACGQLGNINMARRPVPTKPVPEALRKAMGMSL